MSVSVTAKIEETLNLAAFHCGSPLIEYILLEGAACEKVICRISSVPAFLFEYKKEYTLTAGKIKIEKPEIQIDDGFFRAEVIEARDGEIKIEFLSTDTEGSEKVLGFYNAPVHIQPYLHWDALRNPELLPAFMQPNDPLVGQVLKDAGEYANEKGGQMVGYQANTKQSVILQAESIYRALQKVGLHYISPPASYEIVGQKIRLPHLVLHSNCLQGTCLDLAVLYATCLEAAWLHAGVVLIHGHAFAGVWLGEDDGFGKAMVSKKEMTEEMYSQFKEKFYPVECTVFTDEKSVPFQTAVQIGRENIEELQYFDDVEQARQNQINPVYTFTDQPICGVGEERMRRADEPVAKIERLKKQAMDISIGNSLLECSPEKVEFSFNMDGKEYLAGERINVFSVLRSSVVKKGASDEKFNEQLRRMYMIDRDNRAEKGKGSLYLTLNELVWKPKTGGRFCRAVLYLCPMEIHRDDSGAYFVEENREGIRFNPVLRELLIQEYDINTREILDSPADKYEEQMAVLRRLIGRQKGWRVEEGKACVGFFSVPNEAILEGLSDERVLENEIVRSLLNKTMTWSDSKVVERGDAIYAFQADSSQSRVIEAAFKRKAQVVLGPAGNGKTQTIANIMVEGIRRGEKVLFVSEKTAALKVVQEMMKGAGNLEKCCLNVADGSRYTAEISSQIKNTLNFLDRYNNDDWQEVREIGDSQEYMKNIQSYNKFLFEKRKGNITLKGLIEECESFGESDFNFFLGEREIKIDREKAEELIRRFIEVMGRVNPFCDEYLPYIRCERGLFTPENKRIVKEAIRTGDELKDTDRLESLLNLPPLDNEMERVIRMSLLCQELSKCPRLGEEIFDKIDGQAEIAGAETKRKELYQIITSMRESQPGSKTFRDAKRALKEELETFMDRNSVRTFINGRSLDEIEASVLNMKPEELMVNEEGETSAKRKEYLLFMEGLQRTLNGKSYVFNQEEKEEILKAVKCIARGSGVKTRSFVEKYAQTYAVFSKYRDQAIKIVIRDPKEFRRAYPTKPLQVLFEAWIGYVEDGDEYKKIYNELREEAVNAGLENVIQKISENRRECLNAPQKVLDAFRKSWSEYVITQLIDNSQELRRFKDSMKLSYDWNVEEYRAAEKKRRENLIKEIMQIQMSRLPNMQEQGAAELGALGSELGELRKFVRQRPARQAVRSVFERSKNILVKLFPCMCMMPSTVAEYLPQDFPQFDLVIIDEGSQMPTYKALIPISYGKRCMIFGDEEQLIPTNFFQRRIEDEEGYPMPPESILQDAVDASLPKNILKYHYRSENESLVAFSNKEFYNGDIITFPSADTKREGIQYIFVEGGRYDRGKSRTNEKEALEVVRQVKEIYEELSEETKETVGIITMNLAQKKLIQSFLIKESAGNDLFGRKANELVSVVNLEECQGREWDIVVLSPGYGMDENGEFSVNLGAINGEGGRNRLNVMITRARKKMYVVTSLNPGMFAGAQSEGIKTFKEFLAYAQGGDRYDTRNTGQNKEPSGLIRNVAERLRKEGYEVHTNIGSSDFKVDIGVVSGINRDFYSVGILIDHSSRSELEIRDREILYPEVLQRKGWNIYRLHYLSWHHDPEQEIRSIKTFIEQAERR